MIYSRQFKRNNVALANKEIRFTEFGSNTPVPYKFLGLDVQFRNEKAFLDAYGLIGVDIQDPNGFRATVYESDGTILAQEDVTPSTMASLMESIVLKSTEVVGIKTNVGQLLVDMPATQQFTFSGVLADGTSSVLASPTVGTEAAGTATVNRSGSTVTVTGVAPGSTRVWVEHAIGPAAGVTARAYVGVTVVA